MRRTRLSLICFVRALFCVFLLAHSAFPQTPEIRARKVDEFEDILATDVIARLDFFAIELQKEPTAKGFLIVYRARRDLPGLSNRYAQRLKCYLVKSRGISADRLVAVDGGVASRLTQELWIVPPGTAPQPREDTQPISYQPTIYEFDEVNYNEQYGLYYWQDSAEELLEGFGLELQKHPQATGYLVAYHDSRRGASKRIQNALRKRRNYLSKEFRIKPARLKTILGGYRNVQKMELWISLEPGLSPRIISYRRPAKRTIRKPAR